MIQMAETKRELMNIGEAARAAGIRATALRYYEREGILRPTQRTGSGYRLYNKDAIERLEFIRAAQAAGFTLDDIRMLQSLDEGHERTCKAEVQGLIEKRLGELAQKMSDLRRVQAALGEALGKCRGSGGECPVLKGLHGRHEIKPIRKVKYESNKNKKAT